MNIRPDHERGLYGKYRVSRADGTSGPGQKHEHCRYFVLDLDHDPHAKAALCAYAGSCGAEYPKLYEDLIELATSCPFGKAKSETPCEPS